MKFSKLVFAAASVIGIAAFSVPAQAALVGPADACSDSGWNCNISVIVTPGNFSQTFNGPNTGNFQYFPSPPGVQNDDVLIGITNSTGATLTNLFVSTAVADYFPFAFNGDGICAYSDCIGGTGALGSPHATSAGFGNGSDPSGYGGTIVFFTGVTPTAATVNFIGGLANGATAYFSLESEVNGHNLLTIAIPEPETYALMLAGLGLMGFVSRRRKLRAA